MADHKRKTGIKILGAVPWGTHFCLFYKGKKDLLDILVPYIKAGLDNNEFCMCVCSEPLEVEEAKKAFKKAIPNLGNCLKKGQMEILSHTEWYLRRGRFGSKRVLKGWIDKLNGALARGFEGLRLTGNTFWLEKKHWPDFTAYEEEVNTMISNHKMIALCTYSLDRCGVQEALDVIPNHQSTLIRRSGKWTLVESSARKRLEEDLKLSEERLRLAQESGGVGIWDWNPLNSELHLTPQLERLYGLKPGAIRTYEGLRRRTHPDDIARVEAQRDRAIADRKPFDLEFRILHASGETRWVLAKGGAVRNDAGKVARVFGVTLDITERKLMEDALQRSRDELERRVRERTSNLTEAVEKLKKEAQERQRAERALSEMSRILEGFFASTVSPMAILDKSFNFVRVNEAYARICQNKLSDFAGQTYFRLHAQPENEEIFRRVVETKEPYQALAKPLRFTDHPEWGTTSWDWSLSPILDGSGNVEFLVFSLKDVTVVTRALEQLQQDEELLRNVLETVPLGVWVLDRDGKIVYANPEVGRIWGPVRYVGIDRFGEYKAWRLDTGEPIKPEEWAGSRAVMKGETVLNQEVEIESFDGDRRIIFNSAVPILDKNEQIAGAIIINQDITRRRKGEKAVREQAALLDLAHDAIMVCSLDGTILFWNHGAEIMYGWTSQEALGKISHEFLQAKYPEPHDQIMDKITRTGRWEGEVSQVNRRGVPLITSGRWALKVDEKGQPAGILKIYTDITKSKKSVQALKASSQYTRSLIEASLDPLVTISPEGKITDVNVATELATGYSRGNLIGRDFSEYFTDPLKAREGYQEVFLKGEVRDYPLAIRNASGGVIDVLYNATVYKNEDGEVQGVFAAARDITERKKAEVERLRLAKAVEQTAEGVVIMDVDREILYVNPAFERISGFRSMDVLRSTYDDILRMAGKEEGLELKIEEELNRGERWNGHMVRERKGGGSYEVDVVISPVLDETGNLKNYVAVERDVTEEVRFQDHLRQRQKMEALGTLAGGIAHDFNNILMPILINAEMALLDESEGSATSKRLKLVLEAASRGKDLVKQIITFSRRKDQEKNPIRIIPIIKEGLKFLRASIPKNVEIVDGIEAESDVVLADATQIHQVLMNICSNAAYAMREKGGVLTVRLVGLEVDPAFAAKHLDLKPGPYLRLMVSDTGHGMTPEVKSKAFDPFFTTKPPGEGAGMGLAVVHGIVKDLGGAITVYSEVGIGTTFNIFLPWIRGTEESAGKAPGAPPTGTERILFIDDEEMQVRSVPPMLERLGYQVVSQTDARKALEMFQSRPDAFDVVITDQMMPSMTGETLATILLGLRPGLPIILCTGFSETINEERAKAIGVGGFLLKPFSLAEIAETIRCVLKQKT
jgi:PAS domain S-box-containing protein